jgi:hypothetical protein
LRVSNGRSTIALATIVLAVAAATNPIVVRWAYLDNNVPLSLLGVLPAVPLLLFGVICILQERDRRPRRSFESIPLSAAMFVMAGWAVGSAILGYWVLLLGVVVLPAAAALLAVAWVQPTDEQLPATIVLAILTIPFIAWFAGRADEYVSEAVMSGTAIVVLVLALALVRRRGDRATVDRP